MRKALLASAVALVMVGCTSQPQSPSQVQVRDLTFSREQAAANAYTVEPGDTLYGIAWRHDMDFRDLAQLNNIGPPYRLSPGQQLRLSSGGAAQPAPAASQPRGAQVVGAIDVDQSSGNLDWLEPDQSAIERNRRLTAERLEASGTDQQALATASQVGGSSADEAGPGPIFNYESPGADGSLSDRDRVERETRERQAASQAQLSEQAVASSQAAGAASQEDGRDAPTQAESQPGASEAPAQTQSPDAGTAVAGQAERPASDRSQRSYTPVAEVPWQWPSDGQLVGRFGEGSSITAGIDIGGQKGQPVRAAGPGIVVYAGSGVRGYGNLILLKHNDQYLSAYAHNDSLNVAENDVVETGEVIATMGDTDADNVKLHFEIRRDGQPQDPLDYLPSR
ncbi:MULTISPECIES: peptidoglycan DD-metalloendopeptidase family protein [Halomonadaceae]|uniref:peptidoglycan DD-metalloendopeptidase family protein n=1 Tax=Halomonadaceae TaxID=28256 RepID=UPI0015982343|nr:MULTISPECIES: peptidoglycan DD-metalloendopeptidase family protein [Halomonas]QJQ96071.1 peptidoglycan DD-metalloendopeptidase family protein [Halomonas sp. PA5]